MAVLKSLTNLLDKNKIKYEILDHKKVYTAWDLAETEHLKPQDIAKTLVMKLDREYALAVLPASKNLDKVKFKKVANQFKKKQGLKSIKKIDLAKEAWTKKKLKGKVGATPPFGSLFKMATFVDRGLLTKPNLIINSGDYIKSLKVKSKAFVKVESPVIGSFSKKK